MGNNYITDDELKQFKSLPFKKKIDCMEAYLIGVHGVSYNMQDVGIYVFGQENYSYTVSLIHRCYNFSGQNGGKYCEGCKFEQVYGYRVTRRDLESFVKKYPNGTFERGISFEDYLLSKVKDAKQSESVPVSRTVKDDFPKSTRYYQTSFGDKIITNRNKLEVLERIRYLLVTLGSVGLLVLLLLLMSGNLLEYWVVALISLIVSIGAFVAHFAIE